MRPSALFLTPVLVAFALAGAVTAHSAPAPPEQPRVVSATTLYVSGRGWGHGVGMSQYGALGFANEGRAYDEILAHFYPGTTLGQAPVARVRVLIEEQKTAVTVSSPVPFRMRDVFGKTYPLAAGRVELGPKLEVAVNGVPTPLGGPLVILPGARPLQLGAAGSSYRGQLIVSVTGQRLSVVNDVPLEHYLAGVVPREMPAAWHPEALKAQAVAARSYALAHRLAGKGFDLYADVRSQVYGGVAAEDARATAAIDATAGLVLLHAGKIADTLFHSTSGGRTIAAVEAFGKDVPYLVAVDDPHSALSPVHRWGPVPVADAVARKGLGIKSSPLGLQLTREPSGRVRTATIATAAGNVTVSGSALRRGLGLRSTWLTGVSSLTLSRPGTPPVYGRPVAVSGQVKGARQLVLSQRVGGVWQQVLSRPAGGAFTFKTKLLGPASFRLSAGSLVGPVLKVPVAPRVRVTGSRPLSAAPSLHPCWRGGGGAAPRRRGLDRRGRGGRRRGRRLPCRCRSRSRHVPRAGGAGRRYAAGVSAMLRVE